MDNFFKSKFYGGPVQPNFRKPKPIPDPLNDSFFLGGGDTSKYSDPSQLKNVLEAFNHENSLLTSLQQQINEVEQIIKIKETKGENTDSDKQSLASLRATQDRLIGTRDKIQIVIGLNKLLK